MEGLRRGLRRWKRFHIKVHLADEALLLPLTVRPGDTLSDVRAQLVGRGVGSWRRTFYYNARALRDSQTVREARLQDGAVLLLLRDPSSSSRRRSQGRGTSGGGDRKRPGQEHLLEPTPHPGARNPLQVLGSWVD